ncbi:MULTISPECIES: hydrogenase maturation protease [unclassified Streptomyces]|uniref:hydrogenase maturation protease n=1 Tax=Streptomyces TaxID=1883 RepID=UPI000823A04A|nr:MULTISPECIES: hydrogenase maturation protease [unclassified Streptomyces]AWN30525.1 peptidase M52 [Streptomyces sp. NEAU-S7GS2]MYT16726.1 hydrogenase maturation protease [Streptomyces sp. SID4951]SCK34781.1 hydrogenase maturation protease [Streptomyces sp. SceaMP-e96]
MNLTAAGVRIAVIGVGNDYRHDDGVGWTVVAGLAQRRQQRPLPHDVTFLCTDGDPGRLISAWEDAHLAIVVDAAHARPARPGHVHRLRIDNGLPRSPRAGTSSHGFALGDTVRLARTLERLPAELLVYAVEAADTSLGTGLSPLVAAAVEPLIQRITEDLVRGAAAGQ